MFNCRQKINFILHAFFENLQRYCRLVILGILGMAGYAHPKRYYKVKENFLVYRQTKNQNPHSRLSGGYCKDMQTSYFGYFGYACICTPKMVLSNCRKFWRLSACHKYTSSFTFSWDIKFWRTLQFDWLTAFWPITREPDFYEIWEWREISITMLVFFLDYFLEKLMPNVFKKSLQKTILGPFPSLFSQI